MKSNKAPDIELGLTLDQAKFLMKNCNSNIKMAINIAMSTEYSEESQVKAADTGRSFQEIKTLLVAQGVPDSE